MPTTDTAARIAQLEPATTYQVDYVENLRTGARRMVAVVNGQQAATMLTNSTDPRRLAFTALVNG